MLIALNQRIGFQVFFFASERIKAIYFLSPLVGEIYLGVDQGFGRPLPLLSWLLGKPLVYSREEFTGYDHWVLSL